MPICLYFVHHKFLYFVHHKIQKANSAAAQASGSMTHDQRILAYCSLAGHFFLCSHLASERYATLWRVAVNDLYWLNNFLEDLVNVRKIHHLSK